MLADTVVHASLLHSTRLFLLPDAFRKIMVWAEAAKTCVPRRCRPMVVASKGMVSAAIALSATVLVLAAHAAETTTPEGVLIIHSNQRPTPAAIVVEDTLRKVVPDALGRPVELFSEYLDVERSSVDAYAVAEAELLRRKYSQRNIRIIVATAPQALQFATEFRDRMLAGVPVVHIAVPRDQLERMAVPPNVVGETVDLDPTATLELALRLQPNAKRLVIVVGAAERDRVWEQRLRRAVGRLGNRPEVEYLLGLPTADVIRRLSALPKDTIVYTPGYFVDGTGHVGTPRQSLELMGPASAAPVYGPLDTFLGTGIVGGYMASYEEQAKQAGAIVVRLLNGAVPREIAPSSVPNVPIVDWRQIRRWGMDERLLPADTVVRFREPTIWDTHGREISVGVAILALQGGLILWLLVERRRRRTAEIESRSRHSEMALMNRRVAMGALAASIAHELNQPLGAIYNNAAAAQLLIRADPTKLNEVAEVLDDIKQDDKRASEVISRIRAMLRNTEVEVGELDLNDTISDTVKLLAFNASDNGVSLRTELESDLPKVRADRVQVQQVILNLALNAMEAMHDQLVDKRQLVIRSRRANDKEAEVSVADSGVGIPSEVLPRIFEPFVTSKPSGMGLGLSVSHTIVEAHGGHIHADNLPAGGAIVHFTLPFNFGQHA
jgi:signal transduction histidine kinase